LLASVQMPPQPQLLDRVNILAQAQAALFHTGVRSQNTGILKLISKASLMILFRDWTGKSVLKTRLRIHISGSAKDRGVKPGTGNKHKAGLYKGMRGAYR